MKNLHILPTDKPSRLFDFMTALVLTDNLSPNDSGTNHHIYITSSDEKIKVGDWHFKNDKMVTKSHIIDDTCKKIILTTDQDLIKDGVQAINDKFLEWFIANPSCEEVEVENEWEGNGTMFGFKMGNVSPDGTWRYKIILPQEEPKQIKCYCGHTITCDCEPLQETLEETAERIFPKEKHPTSFETLRKAFISNMGRQQRQQETLEEAALIKYPLNYPVTGQHNPNNIWNREIFIEGAKSDAAKDYWYAKWQAERMYSEEDMIQMQINLLSSLKLGINDANTVTVWEIKNKIYELEQLKQFKKK
jgi:hypothetical protein